MRGWLHTLAIQASKSIGLASIAKSISFMFGSAWPRLAASPVKRLSSETANCRGLLQFVAWRVQAAAGLPTVDANASPGLRQTSRQPF
jgi:hypothetical protein